jgi:hypothetical protein
MDALRTSGSRGYWQIQIELDTERAKRLTEPVDVMEMAINYANLGDADKAFEYLEKGFKDHRVGFVFLRVDYVWDKIRSDPRFVDLIRRVTDAS